MKEQHGLNRRRFLQLAGFTVGAAALAACVAPAAPAEGGDGAAPAAAEPVTLRYRTWHTRGASEGDAAWYDWLDDNYDAATIEYEFVPFGSEYIQKVLADSAAGTPPDLLHSSIIWAREFYDRGVLLDLDDYISLVPELAADQFYGEATNRYRSKDNVYYGVPWEGPDSAVISVNSKLLAEAGFDPNGEDIKTWDDFREAANAMTVRDGDDITQAGYLVPSHRYIEPFNSLLVGNGGAMSDDAFSAMVIDSSKRVVIRLKQERCRHRRGPFFGRSTG